jgi:hypothetical protein
MLITRELVHVRAGSGKVVHLAVKNSAHTICGSGYCTVMTRRNSSLRVVKNEVTCKKCLKLQQDGAAQQFGADLYASLIGNDTILAGEQ